MHDVTAPLAMVDEGLGNSSYLIDLGDHRALVIDPDRAPGKYLTAAEANGLSIAFTTVTNSAWAACGCGRWPRPATPPSIWPICSWTATGRPRCSPAGPCW